MSTTIIACSVKGHELAKKIKKAMVDDDPYEQVNIVAKCKSLEESIEEGLTEYVGKIFYQTDTILFVAACGIAVRTIAPYLVHKGEDPAVLAMDETGRYCVALLSGHFGGANAFAEKMGALMGAVPVITTATDNEGKFAVDEFARKNNLLVTDFKLAKEVSVRVLEEEQVYFCSDYIVNGDVPEGVLSIAGEELFGISKEEIAVYITNRQIIEEELQILRLVPRNIVVGLGCKKNTSEDKISKAIEGCLRECGLDSNSICAIASIDLKKDEEGIIGFCEKKDIPFETYAADELQELEGDFSESDFVESITGVSNVCERCAALYAIKQATFDGLLCTKKIYDGVTVALAEIKQQLKF